MSNTVYIDVPARFGGGYDYNWRISGDAAECLRVQEGINGVVNFVCNSLARISDGDVYSVTFNKPEDLTYFLIKGKFNLISTEKAEEYIASKLHKSK